MVVTVTQSSLPLQTSTIGSTGSAAAQTHTIQVGLADHVFKPDTTVANIGDTIEFDFYPLNHSVVRAEYGFPCIPYEMTGDNKKGFFSGFQPVNAILSSPPTYRIRVNDTNPVFFYCSAPGSCLNYGMIGAINPNISTSVTYQHELALNSTYMLNPGEPFPAESPLPSNLPTSSATADLSGFTPKSKKTLSAGAIAGIAIGALSVVVLAALLFFFWGRTKSLKDEVNRKAGTVRRLSPSNSPTAMSESSPTAAGRAAHAANGGGSYQHYQQATATSAPPTEQQQQHMYNHHELGLNGTYPHQNFSTPAPSYFAPLNPQPLKYDVSSPTGHPAYSPPLLSHNNILPQIPITAPFELSPTGDLDLHQEHMHISPAPTATNTTLCSFSPHSHFRSASPHCLASMDHEAKHGANSVATPPVQRQRQQHQQHEDAIPSYFESVYRRAPVFVNGGCGPVEMQGSEVGARDRDRDGGSEGKESEIAGGTDVMGGVGGVGTATATPRWEEVTAEQGKMARL
ncbi:hypothetical protein PTTW11_05577 [Pyrenophora teres f. teres]|uniref:Uncharacterized protein n=1 Tax=Pyrenophora teres f. teres TaxID=97479 RepID=A0A7D9N2K6_9PLEO|nr:hypothetical protein PTNB29_02662 [Pyrenophora teres f. teres]CAE7174154.1 hypothetical protein PTTW11_05577 [Pyrenophora teres f. teres]